MFQSVHDLFDKLQDVYSTLFVAPEVSVVFLDWSTLIPTLVGGLATIAAALIAFSLGNRAEREKREQEEVKLAAAGAMAGYFKLYQWANLIANIDQQIDKHFQQASDNDSVPKDACLVVAPSAGRFTEPERLTSVEYGFLLSKDNYEIAENVLLVESRGINLHHLFMKYSEMRVELDVWLDGLPGFERTFDGPIATDKIPEKFIERYNGRLAQLNRVLAGIIDSLDEDVKASMDVIKDFNRIAYDKFAPHFPQLEVQKA